MDSIKNIDVENIIQKTVFIFKSYPLSANLSPRNENSLWGKVTIELLGKFNFTDALLIQTWWKRDKDSFRSKVKSKINILEKSSSDYCFENCADDSKMDVCSNNSKTDVCSEDSEMEVCSDSSNERFEFIFNKEETTILKKFISSSGANGRKYFLRAFDQFLTDKTENVVPCFLKSKSNWFKNVSGRKNNLPYWRGKFHCTFQGCDTIFDACSFSDLTNSEFFKIKLIWSGKSQHIKQDPKRRITGDFRKKMSLEIMANGIENTRNNMIINREIILYNIFT